MTAMALVIVCGHPSCGKSRVVAQMVDELRQQGQEVVAVDEESLHLERNQSYKGEGAAGLTCAAMPPKRPPRSCSRELDPSRPWCAPQT